jgi:hypothetical protein
VKKANLVLLQPGFGSYHHPGILLPWYIITGGKANYLLIPYRKHKLTGLIMKKLLTFVASIFLSILPAKSHADLLQTASGLRYEDHTLGQGQVAQKGQTAVVHYTGWLDVSGSKGKKFDSSLDRGTPFSFPLGAGRVIRGWDEGVAGMKVGGKRTLYIPAKLGYGERGAGAAIPPNANLIFDVELIDLR